MRFLMGRGYQLRQELRQIASDCALPIRNHRAAGRIIHHLRKYHRPRRSLVDGVQREGDFDEFLGWDHNRAALSTAGYASDMRFCVMIEDE